MNKVKIFAAALGVSALALSASAFAGNPEEKKAAIKDWYAGAIADFLACNVDAIVNTALQDTGRFIRTAAILSMKPVKKQNR